MIEPKLEAFSSEEMLDELRLRGLDLGGVKRVKLANRAIEFLISTVRRLEAGNYDLGSSREWCNEAMRAVYAEELEEHEKE